MIVCASNVTLLSPKASSVVFNNSPISSHSLPLPTRSAILHASSQSPVSVHPFYTFRQSVIVRPMQPSPATSTTFSCQLSNTLIPAPADSFAAPGRPLIWLKPVAWGVTLVGVRGPPDPDVAAMPL